MKDRWLARSAFVLMIAAAAVLIGFAELASLAMVVIGAIGACLMLGGAYSSSPAGGAAGGMAAAVVIATPIAILVVFALHSLIWVALVSVALMALAAGAARRALAPLRRRHRHARP